MHEYNWDFLDHIRRSSFESIENTQKDGSIQGWMPQEFPTSFAKFIDFKGIDDPLVVLEVGSWKGLSANVMACICKQKEIPTRIVCIDTWLGSPEHMEGESASEGFKRVNGLPTIFHEFLHNTKMCKNDDIIYPFPISSTQGAIYLERKHFAADVVYIDAGHEYDPVLMDMRYLWPILKKNGIMIMDDWKWPGVNQAVQTFFKERNDYEITIGEEQVVIQKI